MKLFLVFLFFGSTASFLWFSLLCQGIIPFSKGKYFICAITVCVLICSYMGDYYEILERLVSKLAVNVMCWITNFC